MPVLTKKKETVYPKCFTTSLEGGNGDLIYSGDFVVEETRYGDTIFYRVVYEDGRANVFGSTVVHLDTKKVLTPFKGLLELKDFRLPTTEEFMRVSNICKRFSNRKFLVEQEWYLSIKMSSTNVDAFTISAQEGIVIIPKQKSITIDMNSFFRVDSFVRFSDKGTEFVPRQSPLNLNVWRFREANEWESSVMKCYYGE